MEVLCMIHLNKRKVNEEFQVMVKQVKVIYHNKKVLNENRMKMKMI